MGSNAANNNVGIKPDRIIRFEVSSSLDQLPVATKKLFDFLDELHLNESDRFDIRLSFEEVVINAMKHGNRFETHLPVKVTAAFNDKEVYVGVQDEGGGFDYTHIKDPTEESNLEVYSGRGVYLVQHLMDSLKYSPEGNRVEIVKVLDKSEK